MDIVRFVAERKIEEAIERGEFDDLPPRSRIECTLHGEAFFIWWFRAKVARDEARAHDHSP